MTKNFKTFTKEKACEALAKEKTPSNVAQFIKKQLEKEDGGYWVCVIYPSKSTKYCWTID